MNYVTNFTLKYCGRLGIQTNHDTGTEKQY